MKPAITQTVFIKNQDTKYQCGGCAFWIEGIGNWGGCTVVHEAVEEVTGLHIHKKASCKYWQKPADDKLAQVDDVSVCRFSKQEAIYGAMDSYPASPVGFSCKNCKHFIRDVNHCARFDGVQIHGDDCSDGWEADELAFSALKAYDDQTPPKTVDEAVKLADLYGPHIGSEIKRSLTSDDSDKILSWAKDGKFDAVESFFKSFCHKSVAGSTQKFGNDTYRKVSEDSNEWILVESI